MDQHIPEPPDSPRLFRPRGVGEILAHAFQIYRMHWRNLLALVAVVVIPLTVLQVLLSDVLSSSFEVRETVGGEVVVDGSFAAFGFAAAVVALLSLLTYTILTGAITRAAAATFVGRDLDIAESYRFGLSRFWSIVLVGLLVGLAVLGGLILLVIPGIFIAVRLSSSIAALVIEDRRGRAALSRSWNLVAGMWWPVFGAFLVAGLLTGLLSSALTAPFTGNLALSAIAQSVAGVITMPYTALVGILIYLDLRVRKEQYTRDQLEADLARSA